MEWLPYSLTDTDSDVETETFQNFHLKVVFLHLDFILECKEFVCGG
jgi:hypothetical protein